MSKPSLDGAYGLKTPDDSISLYGEWSETYDETFAQASGYQLPKAVAHAFVSAGGVGPVLDVGAGTGLVGVALQDAKVSEIDGVDISALMLAEAALKDCYENLFEGDMTQSLDLESEKYSGIVSAGTFTHGHVGPDALDELLWVARSGAVFALTINTAHYKQLGFEAKFEALKDRIQGLTLRETPIYDERRQDDHSNDTAYIAVFKKA